MIISNWQPSPALTRLGVAKDEERAYIIVYDGKVWSRAKQFSAAYLGLRCVK